MRARGQRVSYGACGRRIVGDDAGRRLSDRASSWRVRGTNMQVFHIRYRNTQGTLMRILTAASRRGIELPYVQAEPAEQSHQVTLLLEVNAKQVGQLSRDWYAIGDVTDVRSAMPTQDMLELIDGLAATPHPPTSAVTSGDSARAAMA